MRRLLLLGLIIAAVVIFGFSLINVSGDSSDVNASAVIADLGGDTTGFARATAPRDWQFPQDFGAHPTFQTEWWYYTGNLQSADGRRFGYQFTIFRRAISPTEIDTASEWRTNQLYMAHFAVSDIGANQFFHTEHFSRASADLAGAQVDPTYRVWLQDWQVIGLNADDTQTRITAATDHYGVDLTLDQQTPPALEGDHGLSAKGSTAGNASYYYSLPRLTTSGTITIDGQPFSVSGLTWQDHEFSTSALETSAVGWDWFGLQLDDGRSLMLFRVRMSDSRQPPFLGGTLIQPDGSTEQLPPGSFSLDPTGQWTSPHSGATYPAGWNITVTPPNAAALHLTITPLLADQELYGGGIDYWEGAVKIGGDATGYGYNELTGYATSMMGRF